VQNGYTPNHHFAQARDEILALDAKPAGLIITGDTVFLQGEPEDYRRLVKQLEPFAAAGIPVYPLLGNHDNYANLTANAEPFVFKDTPVQGKQITLVEMPHANWFLLDSLEDTKIVGGTLGEEQLRWLAAELDKRPEKPAILAAHHNLEDRDGTLKDQKKLWEIIEPRKQVKAYIYGHTHIYQESVRDGVHLINLPAMGWRFNEKQPLGWTETTIKPNGLELKLHTLDKNDPKNNDVRSFEWQR
jgi:3',5'-cyclic AMP phosphodiesterase CpdA